MTRWLTLAAILAATPAAAGTPYVAMQGGLTTWPATSNSDEIEAGSEYGWTAGLAAGLAFDWGRVELEAAHRANAIHGANGNGCAQASCSADDMDGNVLRTTALMANVWPEYGFGPVSLYAGGGFGVARLSALGDAGWSPAWQVGAGVRFDVADAIGVDAGYRYWRARELRLAGHRAEARMHGPMLRLSYSFGEQT